MNGIGFALAAPLPVKDLVALAQAAEHKGYTSFWVTEGGARDSISQLGALAVGTSRIKLGTGIVNIFSRTPSLMALTASTLAELSNGRFILGLGAGHKFAIEGYHGVPFARPVARMEDYIRIIKAGFRERRVSYTGKVFSVSNFQIAAPRQASDPPIYIATLADRMGRLAGQLADGVLPLLATPQGVTEVIANVQAGAEAVGRDSAQVDIACVSSDLAAAEAEARRQISRYGTMPFYQNMLRRGGYGKESDALAQAWLARDSGKAAQVVSDAMLNDLALVGPPARWRQTLQKFRDAGVTHPVIYAAPVGEDSTGSLMEALSAGVSQ